MTTPEHDLDRIAWLEGVDVTHMTGGYEAALEKLIEAKLAVEQERSITNCRAYVAAHDGFWALVENVARAA
jgi:hypothetical protein